jgi:BlaI family transcriptional regulator, penicillinase repressor
LEDALGSKRTIKLSKFELGLMDVLWKMGRAAIREIHEQLPEKKRPAYTTVQTMVNRLEAKGAVHRVRKIGNAHIYEALITRKAAYRRLLDDVLDLFGGSPQPLMAQLLESGKLSLEDIRALESAFVSAKGKTRLGKTDRG